jgi:membrane protein
VQDALGDVLPATVVETLGTTLQEAKGPAGVIGLVGLLYSGLGWIDALREALRTMWHQNVLAGNLLVKKVADVLALVGLFATIAASLAVTGAATAATGYALDQVGQGGSGAAVLLTRVLGLALSLVTDTALFLYLFARLSRVGTPWRRLVKGAVFGAVGFELLKVVGAVYVARTTSKGAATYGTFAVVVGLLLFLNLFTRLLLFTAAWTVTAPYDSDIPPSGTADRETARKAGIPLEFVDEDEDDPTLQEHGAPSPLQAAVQGRVAPQDEPSGTARDGTSSSDDGRAPAPSADGVVPQRPTGWASSPYDDATPPPRKVDPAVPGVLPGQRAVLTAARVGVGAGAVLVAGVGLHALRSLRDVLRS